jgi:exonuclease III
MNFLTKPQNVDNIGNLCGTRNGKLLKTRFGTWNIRTLYKAVALKNIVEEIKKYKVSIVAIQETRWLGNGNVQSGNSTIFFSGKEIGKHEHGIGFIVSNFILSSIKLFMPVNERLCYLQIAGRIFDICIINGYAPTEDQDEEVKNIFHEDLERLFDFLPNNCIKIIAGDLNAQVGKEQFLRLTIGQKVGTQYLMIMG